MRLFKNKKVLDRKIVKAYNSQRREQNIDLPVCLAAHKSLRFMPRGNITVCCHNNTFVLGVYPECTPKQAWESKEMKLLRKKISKADFTLGCQSCFYAFENELFDSVNPLLYENYGYNNKSPIILDFKITTECNLECIMCSECSSSSISNNNSNRSGNSIYDEKFINSIYDFIPNLKEARFSGGEPFMSEIYFKIWEILIEKNPQCKIFIQTNGTLLNSRIKSLLKDGNFNINVSLDALDSELYSKIRKNANIDKVLSNIEYFTEYSRTYNRKFGITVCAMKDNISEWINLVDYSNKQYAYIWFSEVYFPFVNALWTAKSSELKKYLYILDKSIEAYFSSVADANYVVYKNLIKKLRSLYELAVKRENSINSYCNTKDLAKRLKKKFTNQIEKNPNKWVNIEQSLIDMGDREILDLSKILMNDFCPELMYNELSKLNKAALIKNFKEICK